MPKQKSPQDLAKLQRSRILQRLQITRGEIEQIFTDIASWNDNARQGDEQPIDPDPDGQLRKMADWIDRVLEDEGLR